MRVVSVLVCRDAADVVDAQVAFQLSTGVDLVLATALRPEDGTADLLRSYELGGLRHVAAPQGATERELRTELARSAVVEHGADWVLSSDADEFWWPRGESLPDVLAAIPPRYGVVQGLVRVFPPRGGDGFFADRLTARPSLLSPALTAPEPLPSALRPVYRGHPDLVVDPLDGTEGGRRVPLRAWYPLEVLRFPFRSLEQTQRWCAQGRSPRSALEVAAREANDSGRLAEWYERVSGEDGSLVEDERLRDALRALRAPSEDGFAVRAGTSSPLRLPVPDVVDDASYAGECAAVGEVDIEGLERQIVELEGRITWLEERFWPRVLRQLSRLVPR